MAATNYLRSISMARPRRVNVLSAPLKGGITGRFMYSTRRPGARIPPPVAGPQKRARRKGFMTRSDERRYPRGKTALITVAVAVFG